MLFSRSLLFAFLCFSLGSLKIEASTVTYNFDQFTDLIYGKDDRYEVDQYPDQYYRDMANSVAIRVLSQRLTPDPQMANIFNFSKKSFKQKKPLLCPSEKFIDQVPLGDCSGFLISQNRLVTAGHCMIDKNACSKNKWVFGFTKGVNQLKSENIYSCKKIIVQRNIVDEKEVSDYAVIELDREVSSNRTPLNYRRLGIIRLDTPILVIGHPSGLPMKITDGGKVAHMNDVEQENKIHSWLLRQNYFTTNLDSYAGNSGSPVFNMQTGKVEGILIQGAKDFVFNNVKNCIESQLLPDSSLNSYEKVMRITRVPGL